MSYELAILIIIGVGIIIIQQRLKDIDDTLKDKL